MAHQISAKKFLDSLVAGDMVTFHSQTATHWGIYVGEKKVVHLTGEIGNLVHDSIETNDALFTIAGKRYIKAAVKEEDFLVVATAFDTYERNCKDKWLTPDDPEEIVQIAKTMVGNIYYNDMWNTCEKMASYCRYELQSSPQFQFQSKGLRRSSDHIYQVDSLLFQGLEIKRTTEASIQFQSKGVERHTDHIHHVCQEDSPHFQGLDISRTTEMSDVKRSKRQDFITTHNKVVLNELRPGDLVTFARPFFYHWAVYIGDQEIIHLCGDEPITSDIRLIHFLAISGVPFSKGWVRQEDFWTVAFDSKADINNEKDDLFTPKPVEDIINTAKSMVGKIGYNLFWNNCEHFASKCRYGTKRSDQIIVGAWGIFWLVASSVFAYILHGVYNRS